MRRVIRNHDVRVLNMKNKILSQFTGNIMYGASTNRLKSFYGHLKKNVIVTFSKITVTKTLVKNYATEVSNRELKHGYYFVNYTYHTN